MAYMQCAHALTPKLYSRFSYFSWKFKTLWIIFFYLLVYLSQHLSLREHLYPICLTQQCYLYGKQSVSPCVAWKHMWDEIGDGYKEMGDNTAHGALKQKRSKGICQEIKAQTSWRQESIQMHKHTQCFLAELEVEEKKKKNPAQIIFHLAVFNWSCFQCKNCFSHSTLFCLKVGRPSLRLTHLRKACDVNSEKGMHICMSFRSWAKRKCIRASSF